MNIKLDFLLCKCNFPCVEALGRPIIICVLIICVTILICRCLSLIRDWGEDMILNLSINNHPNNIKWQRVLRGMFIVVMVGIIILLCVVVMYILKSMLSQ